MSCGVLIAAAGQGKRMGLGKNKLFIEFEGKPVLIHTIEKFYNLSWISEIIIVVNPEEQNIVKNLLKKYNLQVTHIVPGGKERQDSIESGLSYIHSDYVMIHDGARPFIRSSVLNDLYKLVTKEDAVVLGVPVKDTIKTVDKTGTILTTPDRRSLWAIQTPQAFRLSIIKKAYQLAQETGFYGTDDSSLVENIGLKVKVTLGDYDNIKITTKEDIKIAQTIFHHWSD